MTKEELETFLNDWKTLARREDSVKKGWLVIPGHETLNLDKEFWKQEKDIKKEDHREIFITDNNHEFIDWTICVYDICPMHIKKKLKHG